MARLGRFVPNRPAGGSARPSNVLRYKPAGGAQLDADASLPITATLTADATRAVPADASLAITATLSAAAAVSTPAAAALAVTATLSATGAVTRPATATLAVTATLSAAATRTAPAAAALAVTATLASTATLTATAAASLAVTATLSATGAIGIVLRGVSTANSGTGLDTSLVTSLAAGCQVDDVAVLLMHSAPGASVNTGPSGWTERVNADQGNAKVGIYTKKLTSGDISTGTATVTRTISSSWSSVLGVWVAGAVDVVSSASASTTPGTALTIPSVTPASNGTLRLALVCGRVDATASAATATEPSGWTEMAESIDTNATARRRLTFIDTLQLSGQSGVSQGTATATASQNVTYGAYSVTLSPVTAGGDTRPSPDLAAIAVIGDSLTLQSPFGTTDVPDALTAVGWNSGKIQTNGVTGRTIVDGANTPTSQDTIDTWRAIPFEPQLFLLALGTNNQGDTVASNMTAYRTLLAKIGPSRNVVLFGTGYYDQTDCAVAFDGGQPAGSKWTASGPAGSPNAAMLNIVDQGTNPATEPTIVSFFDWNNWAPLRAVADPTTIWKMDDTSSPTGQPRHMVRTGYQNYRNVAYALAAGDAPGFPTATASLTVTATLSAAATRTAPATATLAVTATLSSAATPTRVAAATLAATATLTAGATLSAVAAATLPVTATLTAAASTGTAANLAVTATLTAAAVRTAPAAATLTATVTLSAAASLTAVLAAALAATATLAAGTTLSARATASLAVTATLLADATVQAAFTIGYLTALTAPSSSLTASSTPVSLLTASSARGGPS